MRSVIDLTAKRLSRKIHGCEEDLLKVIQVYLPEDNSDYARSEIRDIMQGKRGVEITVAFMWCCCKIDIAKDYEYIEPLKLILYRRCTSKLIMKLCVETKDNEWLIDGIKT